MSVTRVKYVGQGGDIFPDLHWQPKPGEEAEFDDDALGDLTDHPKLRPVRKPKKED